MGPANAKASSGTARLDSWDDCLLSRGAERLRSTGCAFLLTRRRPPRDAEHMFLCGGNNEA